MPLGSAMRRGAGTLAPTALALRRTHLELIGDGERREPERSRIGTWGKCDACTTTVEAFQGTLGVAPTDALRGCFHEGSTLEELVCRGTCTLGEVPNCVVEGRRDAGGGLIVVVGSWTSSSSG